MEAQEQNHLSPYDRVLKAGHIRLVNLEAGDWQSSIRCELIHHDLSSSSAYTALSYAWGAPKATQSIIVNDENFNVTVNLESALRHLKQRSASQLLWVDALVSLSKMTQSYAC